MFTIIIKSKRSSDLLKEYFFLFKPFMDNGTLAFCDWNESGTDIKSSVPDLYNLVKGKTEWRAIILNNDSVYNYEQVYSPDKQNPFDYSGTDTEEMPHESPIPMIRLTHMIGGYSASVVKEFEKGYEYIDENTGEMTRVRESALSEDEIHELSLNYCDSLIPVYMEKEQNPEVLLRQQEMREKYAFTDVRPAEILLIATKRKVESNEKTRIVESWKNRSEMSSSAFWERNKYPNNCRFLFYHLTNVDNSLYARELTEFWLSVLTVATNRIAASTLQAYRLYHLRVDVSPEELGKALNLHLNKMHSVYAFIKNQLKLRPEYSFDEEDELVHRQTIPVALEKNEGLELYISTKYIGLSRDCPEDEYGFWMGQMREKKDGLERFLKTPRRIVDRAANRLKRKAKSFQGEYYELDRFQLDDLKEIMMDLEDRIISSDITNLLDKKKIQKQVDGVDRDVKREIMNRLHRSQVLLAGIVAFVIAMLGFLPYLVRSAMLAELGGSRSWMVLVFVLIVVAVGGMTALVLQRQRLVRKMKGFNLIMRNTINCVNAYGAEFEQYFSDICTYMKAKSILDGIDMRKVNEFSSYSRMNLHRQSIKASIERDNEWMVSYGIRRVDEMIPTVTSFFKSEIAPRDNSLYYFVANEDENDIPINSTGDHVTSPYKFVKKLWIEREDVFDEEVI